MRSLSLVVTLFFVFIAATAIRLSAQTASTSAVSGTVFDKTGAVVPKATVELIDLATNSKSSTTTGDEGQYAFPAVRPGNYKLTVTASGFRQAVISGVKVDIGKAALVNVTLELGQVTQVVEVRAGAGTELQTLDASVGNVLGENLLASMPTLTRDATALLLLQPMAIPGFNGPGGTGESNVAGGTVAGARADQNTFMLDGGDATSNMEGGGGYNTGFVATPRAVVPTPVESLEEFRVETNNPNVTFTRSGGGQVQMVTRRGSNSWHGAGYFYHQNDELNANSFTRNRLKQRRPELRDNRGGGRLGGPIWKDRTFFFVHEEERHFFRADDFSRLAPTAAMRVGILKFRDASGTVVPYNLNPLATIDPDTGNLIAPSGLDPRNKGISPAILAEWNTLPLPNDFSQGDGLRTAGFTAPSPQTVNEHFGVARLDHKINSKWDFTASYRYSTTENKPSDIQVDIGGITPGAKKGVPFPTATRPLQPRFLVVGLTGRLTSNLTNEFHFDWLRHWWAWQTIGAHPVISTSLSDAALQIFRESRFSGLVPINVDTQRARQRTWNGRDYTFIDNLTWIKGKHMWQFGGRAQLQRLFHSRDDKVVGGLTQPIYFVVKGGGFNNITVGSSFRPPACSSTVTTNCLRSGDVTNWKRAYISTLGLVDTASQVLTRAGDLTPNPPFSIITHNSNVDSYELHFSDTWRMTPSFTVTYGLTWGVQLPPFETNRKDTMMVDVNSGQIINADDLLNAKKVAGLNGKVVNPVLGFMPITLTNRKYPYDPDYTNLGPRLAAAWNPSFTSGFLGKIFGDRKTVLRGGWSRAFDRINGVGIVLTPALSIGFGDLSVCQGPTNPAAELPACNLSTNPNTAFRIGVDGNHITVPPLPKLTAPIVPGLGSLLPPAQANSVFETRDFRIDPRRQVGGSDMIDFSIQRELPFNMLLEVGYVGRFSRDLFTQIDLNHIPYMFTPKGTNQTFADAFDKVAAQLQAGVLPANVTPQPWFEAMLGAGGTASAADSESSFFVAHAAGDTWFDLEPSFVTGPLTAFNTQVSGMDWTVSNGDANYQAGFVTLRKRASHGLVFDLNYTFSKSLDFVGFTQENTDALSDAFNPRRTYAPSLFDRRHTFNLLANYELPLGKGKRFASSGVLDKVLGGWSVSGIYTVASGLPLFVYNSDGDSTEFGSTSFNGDDIGWIPLKPGAITTSRNDKPTITSSGLGQNSVTQGVPNAFPAPDTVANNFRPPTFADGRLGGGAVRGLLRWNFDFGVAKRTRITERVSTRFDVQFVNALNHPLFGSNDAPFAFEPNTDLATPQSFGALSTQFNSQRFIQIGLRIDF